MAVAAARGLANERRGFMTFGPKDCLRLGCERRRFSLVHPSNYVGNFSKMRGKRGRPKKQKSGRNPNKRPRRPKRKRESDDEDYQKPSASKRTHVDTDDVRKDKGVVSTVLVVDDGMSEGLHMTTSQVSALGALVSCRECGENVRIGVRPTTKGMISEFTVACTVCEDNKSTNTPNFIRERKRKRQKPDAVLQKTENINYAHVAAFLDNGLGYSGLRHYCKYFNARCLNEATFIVYARQVISDVVADTEESLLYSAGIVREVFKSQLETDGLIDLTVSFTTTYHQWGSDFCLVAGAVIELTTGLVLDYDVANMYCHVCKINAKKIVSMSPAQMTEWFNKHQDTCEIREWCDELDHDADEGVKEIEPKYLECFIAKKIWSRSIEKYGFRYTTLIHESDEKVHEELSRACVYEDMPILIDSATSCFSRRKSEHARTSFQTKLKAKCPRERVQTKDRIMYVYAMSIPEYNKFAISSNIKLRQLVKELDDPAMIVGDIAEPVEDIKPNKRKMKVAQQNGGDDENEELVDDPEEQEDNGTQEEESEEMEDEEQLEEEEQLEQELQGDEDAEEESQEQLEQEVQEQEVEEVDESSLQECEGIELSKVRGIERESEEEEKEEKPMIVYIESPSHQNTGTQKQVNTSENHGAGQGQAEGKVKQVVIQKGKENDEKKAEEKPGESNKSSEESKGSKSVSTLGKANTGNEKVSNKIQIYTKTDKESKLASEGPSNQNEGK